MSVSSFSDAPQTADASKADLSLYRAIWRWHFFAGLLVIPFLLNLACTGSLYLFKNEINSTFFAYRNSVTPQGDPLPPSRIIDAAESRFPSMSAVSITEGRNLTSSSKVLLSGANGKLLVFVDPYSGKVLDAVPPSQEFNQVVRKIHSLDYFGTFTNRIIEAVGGFAMVLVVTGIYLWWPRGQTGGVVSIRGTPSRRVFWRDLHAVTGAFAGMFIFFLALTGMPWSNYWGSHVNAYLTKSGLGTPAELWDEVPTSTKVTQDVVSKSGWTMQTAPVPSSTMSTGSAIPAVAIGVDKAADIAGSLGIAPGFELDLPGSDTGVYTAAIFPEDLANERTIHIDQYSGKPLVDISYRQYPFLGRAIEWGINVHMGQEWGLFNQLLMLATCLCIILACVTAVAMWWKRRPSGRMGVPPMPPSKNVYLGLWIIAGVFGLVFPMSGIAIAAMIALDQIVIRLVPPLKRAFT
ncbi:PepSY-associated TM helix domain-containing protein [Rhizobium sp. 2YAF20]|uniref:PepSY-associated TM helix domain-containing protein n=1 Tax=Rhizobium sp. 2YAF20 TaxID=3233027 RepID=UPI003F9CAD7D